jgi:hypothetical protein
MMGVGVGGGGSGVGVASILMGVKGGEVGVGSAVGVAAGPQPDSINAVTRTTIKGADDLRFILSLLEVIVRGCSMDSGLRNNGDGNPGS